MELKIISPQENGFVEEIKWNNEELKAEIAAKMEDYRGLVFTEENISDAKKDRANLNKLKSAFEDERKRVKKLCMNWCSDRWTMDDLLSRVHGGADDGRPLYSPGRSLSENERGRCNRSNCWIRTV